MAHRALILPVVYDYYVLLMSIIYMETYRCQHGFAQASCYAGATGPELREAEDKALKSRVDYAADWMVRPGKMPIAARHVDYTCTSGNDVKLQDSFEARRSIRDAISTSKPGDVVSIVLHDWQISESGGLSTDILNAVCDAQGRGVETHVRLCAWGTHANAWGGSIPSLIMWGMPGWNAFKHVPAAVKLSAAGCDVSVIRGGYTLAKGFPWIPLPTAEHCKMFSIFSESDQTLHAWAGGMNLSDGEEYNIDTMVKLHGPAAVDTHVQVLLALRHGSRSNALTKLPKDAALEHYFPRDLTFRPGEYAARAHLTIPGARHPTDLYNSYFREAQLLKPDERCWITTPYASLRRLVALAHLAVTKDADFRFASTHLHAQDHASAFFAMLQLVQQFPKEAKAVLSNRYSHRKAVIIGDTWYVTSHNADGLSLKASCEFGFMFQKMGEERDLELESLVELFIQDYWHKERDVHVHPHTSNAHETFVQHHATWFSWVKRCFWGLMMRHVV